MKHFQLKRTCASLRNTENLHDYFHELTLVGRISELIDYLKQLKIEFYHNLLEDPDCKEVYYEYLLERISEHESLNNGLVAVFKEHVPFLIKLKVDIRKERWLNCP